MWFFTLMITTKTDVTQMVETSVFRAILQVLPVCWEKRDSLTGFSIVGSNRMEEGFSKLNIIIDQPHEADQNADIPHWLATPISEDFWFPSTKD